MDRKLSRRIWFGRVAGALALVLAMSPSAQAQFRDGAVPERLEAQQVANLFATWDGRYACDGFFVDLPAGWHLQQVTLLRHGYAPAPAQTRRLNEGVNRYIILPDEELKAAYDLVLRVQASGTPGTARWRVTPFVRTLRNREPRVQARTDLQMEHTVRLEAPEPRSDNRALSFERQGRRPLLLRRQAVPDLGARAPHTVEFWLRTTGLDEVVLSAWDGDEQQPYPLEFMVGPGGRLLYYRGQPGQHQAMTTTQPVADGRWHHVALTHDPAGGWTRLYLDGSPADSLYAPVPPPIDMPAAVALGGRLADAEPAETPPTHLYTGLVDEVRFWPQGRSASGVRRTMRQRLGTTDARDAPDQMSLLLGFEQPLPDDVLVQPMKGLRRVVSDLAFYQPVRRIQAVPEADGVVLRWTSTDARTTAFLIERSSDGTAFEVIADVEAAPGADADDERFTYRDEQVAGRVVYYRIRQRFESGAERVSSMVKVGLGTEATDDAEQPVTVVLLSAYPNPFNPTTTIAYEVEEGQHVQISVTNLAGQQVAQLVDAYREPGRYRVSFDGTDLPSGPYLVRARTATSSTTRKIMLAK